MKTKIFILFVCVALLSLFANAVLAQGELKDNEIQMRGKIPGVQKIEQRDVTDMQKMGGVIDSVTTKCNKMMENMKQMDAQGMMGGQMGVDVMMGAAQNLKSMASQMKMMGRYINKMSVSKEIMGNKEQAEKIKEMHAMMLQTTRNLNQMTDWTQKMMGTMDKKDSSD